VVFAQKVGETIKVGGKDYRLEEVRSDGKLLLQPIFTLDGAWNIGAHTITVNGSTGVNSQTGRGRHALEQSAIDKGYYKVGTQVFRNLRKTGDLTWTGQHIAFDYFASAPSVATGTNWYNNTFTLSADGRTLSVSNGATYTRQ
jgi:hypothetical protein